MSTGALRSLFQLAFQASPIILKNGIASGIPGGLLPIIAITESLNIAGGLLTGDVPSDINDFFAQYLPTPGANLISNIIGQYPFANQTVAGNAIIQNPLQVSLMMVAPVRETGGYLTKLPIFTALQAALKAHNAAGGLYHIATPAFIYTDCIMVGMTDATDGESRQRQVAWQLDFEQPLVTAAEAASVLNSLMSKIANGSQISGNPTWSGPAAALGSSAQGASANVPGSTNLPANVQQFVPSDALQ